MATLNALTRLTSRSHWYTYVWYIHTMRALVQLGARQSSSDPSSSREHLLLRPTRCSLRAVPSSLGSSWVLQYVSTLLQPQQRQEQAHTGLFKGVTRDWGVCEDGVKTQAKRTRASACLEKTRVRYTQGCLGAATTLSALIVSFFPSSLSFTHSRCIFLSPSPHFLPRFFFALPHPSPCLAVPGLPFRQIPDSTCAACDILPVAAVLIRLVFVVSPRVVRSSRIRSLGVFPARSNIHCRNQKEIVP